MKQSSSEIITEYMIKCASSQKPKDFKKFLQVSKSINHLNTRDIQLCRMVNVSNHKLMMYETENRILTLEVSTLKAELESSDRIIMQLEEQNENLKKIKL